MKLAFAGLLEHVDLAIGHLRHEPILHGDLERCIKAYRLLDGAGGTRWIRVVHAPILARASRPLPSEQPGAGRTAAAGAIPVAMTHDVPSLDAIGLQAFSLQLSPP
mgnify:CR=1 FL=1